MIVLLVITDKSIGGLGGQVNLLPGPNHYTEKSAQEDEHNEEQSQSHLDESRGEDPPPRPVDAVGELQSDEEDREKV